MGRCLAVLGGAIGLLAAFGSGSAGAVNEYKGQTYADAAGAISRAGQSAVIETKVGSFLPTDRCVVTASHKADFLDSSGNRARGGKVLLDLNCNYMFALAGVPGNSLASPEGKAAHDQAVQQARQKQQQAQSGQSPGG